MDADTTTNNSNDKGFMVAHCAQICTDMLYQARAKELSGLKGLDVLVVTEEEA
jgi:hypothetical protein